jgi:hypothetical protein
MKFKLLKQLALGFALVLSANATAGIISSTNSHTTSDGSVVNLSGLDWLSWDVTTGQSRTDIENGYMGLLDDGWRYATVMEYKTMMESVFDTHTGWSVDNSDGALWLYSNLYGHSEDNTLSYIQMYNWYGDDAECSADIAYSCYGYFRIESTSGYIPSNITHGWSQAEKNTGKNYTGKSNPNLLFASALVRANVVPEPSILAILALGMIGLASRRFKKRS